MQIPAGASPFGQEPWDAASRRREAERLVFENQ